MASLGADLATLVALNTTFTSVASDFDTGKTTIDQQLGNTDWTGPNSDNFRAAWQEYRKAVDNMVAALNDAATDVKNQHNNIAAATGAGDRI
jgi:uncharacterized protein YukE